jgi:putative glutamine amidotransferase
MHLNGKPVVGIIMDENTSQGGTAYDTGKGYFRAIEQAGGIAVGLPYSGDTLAFARQNCAGLMSTGARIRFPAHWYVTGEASAAPISERFEVERDLVSLFLQLDRPYLGICNGMQMLGCLSGCLMSADAAAYTDRSVVHDDRETRHEVTVTPSSRLAAITGGGTLLVNSFHREAIVKTSALVLVSAMSSDGLIEGIERPDKAFAMGFQWHPERLIDETDDAQALFTAFVQACILPAPC